MYYAAELSRRPGVMLSGGIYTYAAKRIPEVKCARAVMFCLRNIARYQAFKFKLRRAAVKPRPAGRPAVAGLWPGTQLIVESLYSGAQLFFGWLVHCLGIARSKKILYLEPARRSSICTPAYP